VDLFIRLLSYINLAGAVHALIQASVLVLTKRGNRRAHKIMAFFLLAVAIVLAGGMILLLGLYDRWPPLGILMGSIVLVYHPLFYLYIRAMTVRDDRRGPLDLLHGVPFLIGLLAWGAHIFQAPAAAGIGGVLGWFVRSPSAFVIFATAIQSVFYITGIVRLLRAHAARVKSAFATIEPVALGWLRMRLIAYAAIWIVGFGLVAFTGFESSASNMVGQIVTFLIALNTFAAGYRAMLQPEIVLGPAPLPTQKRYERSSLNSENAALYKERLREWMERERAYLDPEITLPKLALSLDIPVAHLSRVINESYGRNFYEFINRYRVEEAKRRLALPDAGKAKLIAVAMDCGFNSVPTFNRVFKEMTGRTPSDYRKRPAPD
jgi:AraC-like DNA-binding protein